MDPFTTHHLAYFTPLFQQFVREVESLPHPNIAEMPEPFVPVFGSTYETSALRLVVVGQDTLGWRDLREFIAAERANPGVKLQQSLDYFQSRPFTEWGPSPQRFWGFVMMMLAALHGQENWKLMQQDEMAEILNSFAWAEGNTVELYESSAKGMGVPAEYWEKVRQAAEPLNRFRHLVETLRPHAALILYRRLNPKTYFEGLKHEEVSRDGRLTHYRLPEVGVDVFHAPHPGNMNRIEGTDHFRGRLEELFARHKLVASFPQFLNGGNAASDAMDYLKTRALAPGPDFDKFAFVSWVAEELTKRRSFMSVPALIELVNARGYRTNRNTPFVEKSGGHGPYKLVSCAYHHFENSGTKDGETKAHNIAVAFRRPNFEYAYKTD